MNIGVEARILSTPVSGMGRFLLNMLRELHDRNDGNRYFLYSHRPFKLPFAAGASWQVRVCTGLNGWNGSWWLVNGLPRMAAADGIDVFWGTSHVLPPLRNNSIRTVLTVHDLAYASCPETMRLYSRTVSRMLVPRAVRVADTVVCVSDHIADEVRERFPDAEERVQVIPEGVDTTAFKPESPVEARAFIKDGFGVRGPYFVHVGTLEPRKRIDVILDAFREFRRSRPEFSLVLAGGRGWKSDKLYRRLREPGVRYLEYVLDSHLPYLYSGAAAAVSASTYEGFGLPVLEAAACGTPVVLPDVPWARGIGGDAAYYYDAGDASGLAAALGMLAANDGNLRTVDVKPYQWRTAADAYADLFRRLGEQE